MAKKLNKVSLNKKIIKKIEDGLSDYQIYKALKVAPSTFNIWKKEHEQEYNDAKEVASLNALDLVEQHLNKKIFGGWRLKQRYEIGDDGREKLVSYERQQVDPELNAIMFYLKANNPNKWNALEIAKLKQDEGNIDNIRQLVQDLSKYDVKNYADDNQEVYEIPSEFDDDEV